MRIVETRQVPSGPGGQMIQSFESECRFSYHDGRLASEVDGFVGRSEPLSTTTFDPQGHCIQVTFSASDGRTPGVVTTVESAQYAGDQTLAELSITRSDGKDRKILVTSVTGPTGVTSSWEDDQTPSKEQFTLHYDPAGRLLDAQTVLARGATIHGPSLTYNDHGDVTRTESAFGNDHTVCTYDYVYDAQANWTRRTQYIQQSMAKDPSKKLRNVIDRQIIYDTGSSSVGLATAAATGRPASRPASSQPAIANAEIRRLAGVYKAVLGDRTAARGFYSVMTLALKSDATFVLNDITPDPVNRGHQIVQRSEGTCAATGQAVNFTIDTGNGKALEANDPQRHFHLFIKNAGKELLSSDGIAFKKD